jgi:hypothetical protein
MLFQFATNDCGVAKSKLAKNTAYIGIESVKAKLMNLTMTLVGIIIRINNPMELTMPTIQYLAAETSHAPPLIKDGWLYNVPKI